MYKAQNMHRSQFEKEQFIDGMETNLNLAPAADELTLDSSSAAKAVTLACYKTVLKTAVAGAIFDLPDGEWAGQRKWLTVAITGSGTAVASAAALAKLASLAMIGAAGLTGFSTNDVVSALVLDAANEQVLLEWTGAKWNVIYATTGVVTLS
ncbi:MAG: hypothetical protein ACM31O_01700 [Bacteroidota bacterium]